jgi:hypothetical protein
VRNAGEFLAVLCNDKTNELQFAAFYLRVTCNRRAARAIKREQKRPFRDQCRETVEMIDLCEQRQNFPVLLARLDCNDALRNSGRVLHRVEDFRRMRSQAEPLQSCVSQDRRIALACFHLVHARLHVAAQQRDLQVGANT